MFTTTFEVKCKTRTGYDIVKAGYEGDYTPSLPYTTRWKYGYRKKKECEYIDNFGTFDIETTSITHYEKELVKKNGLEVWEEKEKPDFAFMYVWMATIDGENIVGREWSEFLDLLNKLKSYYMLGERRMFVIYVHNLPFEFSFLQGYIKDYSDVFATGARKPLVVRFKELGIELRCSYKLTNMSLENFTKKTPGCIHIKAVGDLDYTKIRTSKTPLTDTEWGYCIPDTLGLWESIAYKMKQDGDNIVSIPLTSTSYVRRDMKNATKTQGMKALKSRLALTGKQYAILKEAFRGGDTHANKVKCNRVYKNVYSFDASSMYPAMQLLRKYPMTKFELMPITPYTLLYLKEHTELAWFATLKITGIRMKEDSYNPYLSISKCKTERGKMKDIDCDGDNGRIWACDVPIYTSMTDVDFSIITECYDIDEIEIVDGTLYTATYDYLPKEVISVIMEYFEAKTKLKEVVKKCKDGSPERAEAEYNLMKAKNKLNGIYGMSATDPVHPVMLYDGEWFELDYKRYENEQEYRDRIDKIGCKIPELPTVEYACEKSTLAYQWGVWCTAWARKHLREILACAGSDYIYCDTDSCKATSFNWGMLKELNERTYKECEERHAYVEINGKKKYIGFFDCESELKEDGWQPEYYEFKTLGAKKYCYNKYGDTRDEINFGCTISGVSKSKGIEYIKTLDNFTNGFKIKDSGGFNVAYGDNQFETVTSITDYRGEKAEVRYTGYSCMMHREYEIGCTDKQLYDWQVVDLIAE